MQDTSVSFGYQLDVPKANLLFKGIERLFSKQLHSKQFEIELFAHFHVGLHNLGNQSDCDFSDKKNAIVILKKL